jgi:hypothetical protein
MLTDGQRRAALVLGRGGNDSEAAEAAGTSRSSIKRWRKDGDFREAVSESSDPATAVFLGIMLDPKSDPVLRMRAARSLGRAPASSEGEGSGITTMRIRELGGGAWEMLDEDGEEICRGCSESSTS